MINHMANGNGGITMENSLMIDYPQPRVIIDMHLVPRDNILRVKRPVCGKNGTTIRRKL